MNVAVLKTWLAVKIAPRFAKDEQGAYLAEYILLAALIGLALIATAVFLRDNVGYPAAP